jgi:hypothetical protein
MRVLIEYQQLSVAAVSEKDGPYESLFRGERELAVQTEDLYDKKMPWALAGFGAEYGSQFAARAGIAAWKESLNLELSAQRSLPAADPRAAAFRSQSEKALGDALAQTALDSAYIDSRGAHETADSVYARKIANFSALAAYYKQGAQFYAAPPR